MVPPNFTDVWDPPGMVTGHGYLRLKDFASTDIDYNKRYSTITQVNHKSVLWYEVECSTAICIGIRNSYMGLHPQDDTIEYLGETRGYVKPYSPRYTAVRLCCKLADTT